MRRISSHLVLPAGHRDTALDYDRYERTSELCAAAGVAERRQHELVTGLSHNSAMAKLESRSLVVRRDDRNCRTYDLHPYVAHTPPQEELEEVLQDAAEGIADGELPHIAASLYETAPPKRQPGLQAVRAGGEAGCWWPAEIPDCRPGGDPWAASRAPRLTGSSTMANWGLRLGILAVITALGASCITAQAALRAALALA